MNSKLLLSAALAAAIIGAPSAFADDGPVYVQFSNAHPVGNPAVNLPGAAILTRTSSGVEVSLHFTGLDAYAAYTAWWVVFNNPSKCTIPCGPDDVGAGVGQVFHATGYVTGDDGVVNVSAHLARGAIPIGADRRSQFMLGASPAGETGLQQPYKAEIHLVAARSHGPLINGAVAGQIGSFAGSCVANGGCVDQQAVMFPPAN